MASQLLTLPPFDPHAPLATARVLAVAERAGTMLSLRWVLEGLPAGARIPPPARAPARTDRLWEHTCLEAFVAPVDAACYWEVNLSPAGHWNVYRFDDHRQGMTPERRVHGPAAFAASSASATGAGTTLTLAATLDLGPLAELGSGALDVGLAAVVETDDGRRLYALRHAGAEPDFHARETFVLRLDARGRGS